MNKVPSEYIEINVLTRIAYHRYVTRTFKYSSALWVFHGFLLLAKVYFQMFNTLTY